MFARMYRQYRRLRLQVQNDPNGEAYRDTALSTTGW